MNKSSRGYQAWLPAERWPDAERIEAWKPLLGSIAASMDCRPGQAEGPGASALRELVGGIGTLTGLTPALSLQAGPPVLLLGSQVSAQQALDEQSELPPAEEAYALRIGRDDSTDRGGWYAVLRGRSEYGLLQAVFALLRLLGTETGGPRELEIVESPRNRLRMIDQWDNMDGSVERGYSGDSIFYRDNRILLESPRIADYARLLGSVGINAICINNVNVHREETKLITASLLPDVARLTNIFAGYGIKLFLSVNYAAPIELGELNTADPLDSGVQQWWM